MDDTAAFLVVSVSSRCIGLCRSKWLLIWLVRSKKCANTHTQYSTHSHARQTLQHSHYCTAFHPPVLLFQSWADSPCRQTDISQEKKKEKKKAGIDCGEIFHSGLLLYVVLLRLSSSCRMHEEIPLTCDAVVVVGSTHTLPPPLRCFARLTALLPPFAFLFFLSTRLSWSLPPFDTLIELAITPGWITRGWHRNTGAQPSWFSLRSVDLVQTSGRAF